MPISFDPLSAGIPALSIKSLEREMFGPAFMGADDSFGLGSSLYASPFFDEGPIGISAPIGNYNRFAANSPIGLLGIGSVDFVSSFIDSAKAYRDRGGWKMPEYDYSVFNPSSANAPHEAKRHDEIPDASDDMSSEDPHAAHKKEAEEAETAEEVAIDPVGSEESEPGYITKIKSASALWDGKDIEHPIVEVNQGDDGLYHLRYRYLPSLNVAKIDQKGLQKLVGNLKTFLEEHDDVIFKIGDYRFGNAATGIDNTAGLTANFFKAQIPQSF